MNTLTIQTPIFQLHSQTLTPSINSLNHSHQNQSNQHIVANKLKGNKIHMSQIRQKQQLKTQMINNLHSIKNYVNTTFDGDFFNRGFIETREYEGINTQMTEFGQRNMRPRTGGLFTADSTLINRRKRMSQNMQAFRNRTMIVTSSSVRNRMQSLNHRAQFNSPNLDEKTNNYMNIIIRNQMSHPSQSQNFINHIHTQGIIPHSRRLNNFQRKMKKKIKAKSESKQKIKINLDTDLIDLKTISKTLQTINSHNQSPLVSTLEQKTIFGKLYNKNNMKKNYYFKNQ